MRILKPEFFFWQAAKYPTLALVPTEVSAPVSFDSVSAHLSNFGVSSLPCDLNSLIDLRRFDD